MGSGKRTPGRKRAEQAVRCPYDVTTVNLAGKVPDSFAEIHAARILREQERVQTDLARLAAERIKCQASEPAPLAALVCAECEREFVPSYRDPRIRFCCKQCAHRWHARHRYDHLQREE